MELAVTRKRRWAPATATVTQGICSLAIATNDTRRSYLIDVPRTENAGMRHGVDPGRCDDARRLRPRGGNISHIDFKEVVEGERISYVGTFSTEGHAGLRFDVIVLDPRTGARYRIDFEQTEL